jgi:8-oxo-dGTP pyrophosphatase MutT (NUDIX family)
MRAQVVLLQEGKLLLARHEKPSKTYWVLPGGAIEENESPEEAAVREVKEETGLDIRLSRLLFVEEPCQLDDVHFTQPRYTYFGEIIDGSLESRPDVGGHPVKGRLTGCEWVAPDDVRLDAATRATIDVVLLKLSVDEVD